MTLNDSEQVYGFYRTHQQPAAKAKALYGWLAAKYRPHVSYEAGAANSIRSLRRDGYTLVISANHVRESDPFILAAAGFCSPLRPMIGRVRVLAKDTLFRDPDQRRKIDVMGGIRVFRPKDHGIRESLPAGRQLIDTCAQRVADGDWIAVFPEGTCNTGDQTRLQPLGSAVGHILSRAHAQGKPIALVSVGIAYRDHSPRRAEVVFNTPRTLTAEDLSTPAAATRLAAADLQAALDVASAKAQDHTSQVRTLR